MAKNLRAFCDVFMQLISLQVKIARGTAERHIEVLVLHPIHSSSSGKCFKILSLIKP